MAAEWFVQRREADGRPHDPRVAKRLADQAARAAAAAAGEPGAAGARPGERGAGRVLRGPMPGEEGELLRLMRAAAAEAAAAEAAGAAAATDTQIAPPAPRRRVVGVTAREMAAMRSALPSPKKMKGLKLAEELEMKASGERARAASLSPCLRAGLAAGRRGMAPGPAATAPGEQEV
jgi:hypothetical protein